MKISFKSHDITFVVTNLLVYRIFTQIPMTFFKASGSAPPISALISGILAIAIIWFFSVYLLKNNGGNLLDTANACFGKLGRLIFTLLIVFYLAVSVIFSLENFSSLIRLIAFPASPLWFITAFLTFGAVLGALGSIGSVVRIHGVFVPIIVIILALLIASTICPDDTSHLFSLPENGLKPLARDGFKGIILYTDIILLLMLTPTGESRIYITKAVNIGAISALVLNFLFVLAFTLKIPQSIAQSQQFPIYLLMKEVYFGRFFQRLDALVLLASALSSMLYISLSLNIISTALRQGLGLSPKPPVTILIGIFLTLVSLQNDLFRTNTLLYLVYICGFGVMAFSLLASIFSKVRCSVNEKE